MSKTFLGSGFSTTDDTVYSVTENARKWDAKRRGATTTTPARILFLGDSITEGATESYVRQFRKTAAIHNGNRYSVGWVNGHKGTETNIDRDYIFTVTTGSGTMTTDGPARYAISLATNAIVTLQDDAGVNATPYADAIEIRYTKSGTAGAGDLEIRVDGTLVTTLTTYDAGLGSGNKESGFAYTWTGTRGPHALTVKAINGAAIFEGAYIADGDTVYVYNGGHSGLASADFTGITAPWQFVENADIDLLIWAHGINDGSSTTYETGIAAFAAAARAAVPDISLGIVIPFAITNRTTWDRVVSAGKGAAATAGIPRADVSWMFDAPPSTADPYGLTAADDTHVTQAGASLIGARVARFVFGFDADFTTLLSTTALTDPKTTFAAQFRTTSGFFPAVLGQGLAANPVLELQRKNGTDTAPTAVTNGQIIGRVSAGGQYGTGDSDMSLAQAGLTAKASQNHTSTNRGTKWEITTTPDNTISPVVALTVGQDASITDVNGASIRHPVLYHTETTVTTPSSTAAQTLFTYTVPASTLAANGDRLRIRLSGDFLTNSGTPTFIPTFNWGALALTAAASATETASANPRLWLLDVEVVRLTSTTQAINGVLWLSSKSTNGIVAVATTLTYVLSSNSGAETLSGTVTVSFQSTFSVANASNRMRLWQGVVQKHGV